MAMADTIPSCSLPLIFLLSLSASLLASARPFRSCHPYHTSFNFPDFRSGLNSLALLGDAQISAFPSENDSPAVQVSGSQPLSFGSLFYSKPVRFLTPFRSRAPLSFSAFFSFSMLAKEGDGLAFVIAPDRNFNGATGPWLGLASSLETAALAHTVAVEFDSKMNKEVQDPNDNHVGIHIESLVSLATSNASDLALILNDGGRLYAWIDYYAPVHVLEVRLSKLHSSRPWRPILTHRVDLSSICKEEMFVGFSSSTGDSPQKHFIYSWSFMTMDGRMHSIPAKPHGNGPYHGRPYNGHWNGPHHGRPYHDHPHFHHGVPFADRMDEFLRIGISLMLGALCGSAVAASMLLVWSFLRRQLNPSNGEVATHPMLFGYQQLVPEGK